MAALTLIRIRNGERRRNAVAAFVAIFVTVPTVYMLMDRDPPFTRVGMIVSADPRNCELANPSPHGFPRALPEQQAIRAGSCIEVIWAIDVKRNCPQSSPDNVSQHLRDATGVIKSIGSSHGIYGKPSEVPITGLRKFVILPSPMPIGPATYSASACYACNPLQRLFWPICVDKPDIEFEVVE